MGPAHHKVSDTLFIKNSLFIIEVLKTIFSQRCSVHKGAKSAEKIKSISPQISLMTQIRTKAIALRLLIKWIKQV
jgi:hypothetical protein